MRKIARIVNCTIGIILIGILFNIIPNEGICDAAASYGLVPSITVPVINVSIDAAPYGDPQKYEVTTAPWVCEPFIFQLIGGGIALMFAIWLVAHFGFPDAKPKNQ